MLNYNLAYDIRPKTYKTYYRVRKEEIARNEKVVMYQTVISTHVRISLYKISLASLGSQRASYVYWNTKAAII